MPVSVSSELLEVPVPEAGAAGDDIMAKRREMFRRHEEADGAGKIDLSKVTAQPAPVREPIESVIVQTPAGEVEFGPPPGVSLTLRLAQMLGESNPNRLYSAMLRTLMCVRKIDNKAVTPITSEVEAQYLANLLGDGVIDYLFSVMVETWPPPAAGELQVLRKNKRVT